MDQESPSKVPEGLGGWLLLVGIGVIFSPLRIMVTTGPLYVQLFQDGSFDLLTTPGTEAYHPFWLPFIFGEIGINIAFIVAGFCLIYLFFTKNIFFPKLYIYTAIFSLVFILIDAALIRVVISDAPIFDPETIKELVRSGIVVALWVPYMLVSKRVKATFVR